MDYLPTNPGSYALFLHLPFPQELTIGRLGTAVFPEGEYSYFGSARGPGGLRARLGRHLQGDGKSHWHIDYLRSISSVTGFIYLKDQSLQKRDLHIECIWAQAVLKLPGIRVPMSRFGASDCKSGCQSHLIYIPNSMNTMIDRCRKILAEATGSSAEKLIKEKFD